MDHARHLSSPSPTSSFLFHHSERTFKSSLLTPSLLSSPSDVNNVEDCFSMGSSTATSNQENMQNRISNSFGDNHHDDQGVDVNHGVMEHQNHCVIDHNGLNGVGPEEDDGMHNMLSGSSTSSTTTIPLLTDSHSHNPFSRISLEEYSPLSLVDDCDNALTISPTSLVCGSHHSFKSSLNNLKMENLDGVDVHVDDGDARSMSPSLLSATTSGHQNHLWSNSSTAITQNPVMLTSASTSFLLSHHHHHQLNSLMHQLEPQSLDEPPPLIGQSSLLEPEHVSNLHRPSSEPPPGSELTADVNSIDVKSGMTPPAAISAVTPTKSKTHKSKDASVIINTTPVTTASRSSRKNRAKTASNSPSKLMNQKSSSSSQDDNKKQTSQPVTPNNGFSSSPKAHLESRFQSKLLELQQRLFGTVSTSTSTETNPNADLDMQCSAMNADDQFNLNDSKQSTAQATVTTSDIKLPANKSSVGRVVEPVSNQKSTTNIASASAKSRSRSGSKRKPKAGKNYFNPSSSIGSNVYQKGVKTESVEPDTTTKSSDCIKLADLLSSTNSIDSHNGNSTIILSNNSASDLNTICEQGGSDSKRVQHIQFQVNPTLKLVANNGLIQTLSMQPQQQISNNVTVVSSGCGSFNNQVLCRPVNVMTSMGNTNLMTQNDPIKCNIIPNNDWLKTADSAMVPNCNNSGQANNTSSNAAAIAAIGGNHTIGAHQIAIQVICQDGTSLVLPVSSTSGLNAAVSLGPQQQQQLQAVLSNVSKNSSQQQQRTSNQVSMPLISVSNILAQQQTTTTSGCESNGAIISDHQSGQTSGNSSAQASGLAASSPTLAALLDAGSTRNNVNESSSSISQNIASTNLLRKLIGGNVELKRGEQLNLQPGTQIGLTNNGSLFTICTTNANGNVSNHAINSNLKLNSNTQCLGDKLIKLENVTEVGGNIQTTFTLIEPQGLIVANGNDNKLLQADSKQTDLEQAKMTLGVQSMTNDSSSSLTNSQQQSNSIQGKANSNNATVNQGKQNKMASSTGNRQVDPTQPFRCEHCNSTFTRLGNFTRHKKIHSAPTKDGQRFKCDVCSKSFLQRCDLARHLHIHRGTEPHRCNICGKGYIRHSDLVTHQRFHNKEKPFGCPHCNKGFCQRGDLNRHLRSIHLQLKPLLCPCCNRKFAKRDTLTKHISTHHRHHDLESVPAE